MKGDKISIIVPAYNIENYIENTVKSICDQTYRNLEIILVNDGSTDQTASILDKLAEKDERIKILHKENGGVTSARLCGVEAATGEWIGFVDGDDYIEPQMYEMLITNALKYQADISHCGYQMVFPSRTDMYYGTGRLVEQNRKTGLKDLLEGAFIEPGLCNKLFHKSIFAKFLSEKKMDVSIKNNEDLLMNFYLFSEAQKSIFIDECPYHYMVRKGSAATGIINKNKLEDPLKVLKILEKETENIKDLQLIVKNRIIAQLIGLSTISLGKQSELIKPYRTKARKELRGMVLQIIKGNYSRKLKVMTLGASVLPGMYGRLHKIYHRITGLDKKYEVS